MIYSAKNIFALTAVFFATTTIGESYEICDTVPPCDSSFEWIPSLLQGSCGNWYGDIELLYWKTAECGIAFATRSSFQTNSTIFNPTQETNITTKVYNPKFQWNAGIRLGLGYDFNYGWDINLYYLHFCSQAKGSIDNRGGFAETGSIIFPAFGSDLGLSAPTTSVTAEAQQITGKWRFNVDLADLTLGNEFCIGKCVFMRPFIGVRASWTKQKYHILAEAPAEQATFNVQDVFLKSQFQGAGLRSGFDTEWQIGYGFSIYSTAAISVLYGRGKASISELNIAGPPINETTIMIRPDQNDSWLGCRAMTDLALGFQYRQFYCCNRVMLTLGIGWEHHMFFNENRFEDFAHRDIVFTSVDDLIGSSDRSPQFTRGDLCLQGWTLSANVEF